jgi:hypothetical protein
MPRKDAFRSFFYRFRLPDFCRLNGRRFLSLFAAKNVIPCLVRKLRRTRQYSGDDQKKSTFQGCTSNKVRFLLFTTRQNDEICCWLENWWNPVVNWNNKLWKTWEILIENWRACWNFSHLSRYFCRDKSFEGLKAFGTKYLRKIDTKTSRVFVTSNIGSFFEKANKQKFYQISTQNFA